MILKLVETHEDTAGETGDKEERRSLGNSDSLEVGIEEELIKETGREQVTTKEENQEIPVYLEPREHGDAKGIWTVTALQRT